MALTVLNPALDRGRTTFREYSWTDVPAVAEWRRKGIGQITTLELSPVVLRHYSWAQGFDEADRRSWQAFFEALGWIRLAFLLRDPRDGIRTTTLEPAVGDGARVQFSLPTAESHADYAFFPQNDLAVAYGLEGGAARALASIDPDGRTVTFAAAPGAVAVGLVYQPLRLVRLVAPPEVQSSHQVFARASLELEQLVRT